MILDNDPHMRNSSRINIQQMFIEQHLQFPAIQVMSGQILTLIQAVSINYRNLILEAIA